MERNQDAQSQQATRDAEITEAVVVQTSVSNPLQLMRDRSNGPEPGFTFEEFIALSERTDGITPEPVVWAQIPENELRDLSRAQLQPPSRPTCESFLRNHLKLVEVDEKDNQCNICFEPYDKEQHTPVQITDIAGCPGHIFGMSCLHKWVETSTSAAKTCPLCRAVLCQGYEARPIDYVGWLLDDYHRQLGNQGYEAGPNDYYAGLWDDYLRELSNQEGGRLAPDEYRIDDEQTLPD